MRVTEAEFVKRSARYLEELGNEPILITRGGQELAVLTRPSRTSVQNTKRVRLLGCMKGLGTVSDDLDIKSVGREEIADMFGLDR
ncbi:MAG: hypothetical protein LBS35_00840 [Synergistaceae bacterium]|jgi:hypothetical protein|nr:hypothetical protein [Synergistaceae bacterium]